MIGRVPTVEAAAATYAVDAARAQERPGAGRADERHRGGRGQPGPGRQRSPPSCARAAGSTRPPGPTRRSCSARRPPAGSRSAPLDQGVRVWIGDQWFAVVGVLEPVVLAPELDETALIGLGVAAKLFGDDLPPTTVYTRVDPDQVVATRALLGRTANPSAPTEVDVSRPSDALEAQAAADESLTTLTLGLGAVALLVGAVGIANVMVISVLERRREIGVRRALGATRAGIGSQFLTESVLLSLLGGLVGGLLGVGLTTAFAVHAGLGRGAALAARARRPGVLAARGHGGRALPGAAGGLRAADGGAAGDLGRVRDTRRGSPAKRAAASPIADNLGRWAEGRGGSPTSRPGRSPRHAPCCSSWSSRWPSWSGSRSPRCPWCSATSW